MQEQLRLLQDSRLNGKRRRGKGLLAGEPQYVVMAPPPGCRTRLEKMTVVRASDYAALPGSSFQIDTRQRIVFDPSDPLTTQTEKGSVFQLDTQQQIQFASGHPKQSSYKTRSSHQQQKNVQLGLGKRGSPNASHTLNQHSTSVGREPSGGARTTRKRDAKLSDKL